MAYWLSDSLMVLPFALWVYLGLGIPLALLALPRQDWQKRIWVIGLGLAFAPALMTAWLFVLGVVGGMRETAYLRLDLLLVGLVVLTILAWFSVWRKKHQTKALATLSAKNPLAWDEKILISLIVLAVLVRLVVTAYWSFTAYDALWVYGYQSRLYFERGYIPQDIGYYPQFLQLQYTALQLVYGAINDHAARVAVPFLHIGSICAAYILGSGLFTRRVGIFLAAFWALYPQVAQWAYVGDLEIPIAFLFTLSSAFFLMAWSQENQSIRRRYALIAGLCFGIAMWTKPTAGAFVWGVLILVSSDLLRLRFDWKAWYPRFEVALITGLACIPLGTVWYVRNLLLGLDVLVFPHPSWLSLATRSGDLLSLPIFALLLLVAYLLIRERRLKEQAWILLVGILLILWGAMPASPLFNPARTNPPESYLRWYEIALLICGFGLSLGYLRRYLTAENRPIVWKAAWTYLLALPYFMTWFYSYSYHARLVFAINPLLMLIPAALLAEIFNPHLTDGASDARHPVEGGGTSASSLDLSKSPVLFIGWRYKFYLVLLVAIGIPASLLTYFSLDRHHDWLWTNRYPDDFAKYKVFNPGVTLVAENLLAWRAENGHEPVIMALGEQRLPFFLLDATIITDDIPLKYADLAGVTHFIYGTQARWRYEEAGILPTENAILASLGRKDIMRQVLRFTDGTFRYELYELMLEQRFIPIEDTLVYRIAEETVQFGDFVRLGADNVGNDQLAGNTLFLDFLWQVIAPAPQDYLLQFDLVYEADGQIYYSWQAPVAQGEHAYYNSQLWEAGEHIIETHALTLPPPWEMPRGAGYRLYLNFVDRETGQAVPVTINGELAERGYPLKTNFAVGRAD